MADKKISELPALSVGLTPNTDVIPVVHAGVTSKVTLSDAMAAAAITTPTPVTTVLGDFSITNTSPVNANGDASAIFATTNDGGWAADAGTQFVTFEFQTTGYFTNNPNGHIAVILRYHNPAQPRGGGIAMGNLAAVSSVNPTSVIEDFTAGTNPPGRVFLLPDTDLSASTALADGVRYRFDIWNKVTSEGQNTVRYVLYRQNANLFDWDLQKDTGDCIVDINNSLNHTGTGIEFAEVFRTPAAVWTIAVYGLTTTWGPCDSAMPNLTKCVNVKGDTMTGDLTLQANLDMSSNGRKIKVKSDGVSFTQWTGVQAALTNSATTLTTIPNGTSTTSNFMASNHSGMVNFSVCYFGIEGNRGLIHTLGVGTGLANPPIDVKINNVTIGTYESTGKTMYGNLTFSGNNRRIITYNDSSLVNFDQWTRFVTSVTNSNTTVLAAPNGTSTASNFMACNNSNLSGAYGSVSMGMVNTVGRILTYTVGGGAHPNLEITIGATTPATFKTTGIRLNGANEDIGASSARIVVTNPGGANALALSQANLNLETYCAPGYIAGLLVDAGWTAGMKGEVETAVRPIICLLSSLIKDAQERKVMGF